jgi:hypothetical protein
MRRLEAAAQMQDFSEVTYRDVMLVVGEIDYLHRRGWETLQTAYRAVHSIMRARYPEQINALDEVRGYKDYEPWERSFITILLAEAQEAVASPFYRGRGRVLCPLCSEGPEQLYAAEGFLVPEGLKRHLTGYGNMQRCNVLASLRANSDQFWQQ